MLHRNIPQLLTYNRYNHPQRLHLSTSAIDSPSTSHHHQLIYVYLLNLKRYVGCASLTGCPNLSCHLNTSLLNHQYQRFYSVSTNSLVITHMISIMQVLRQMRCW